MTVKVNGKSAVVQPTTGTYTITGVTSGLQNVTVTPGNSNYPECVNATDAGAANYWSTRISPIAHVKYLAGDVNADNAIDAMDVQSIQHYFVLGQPYARAPWSFWNAQGNIAANSDPVNTNPITVSVNGTSVTLDLLGMITDDFNGSLNPLAVKSTGAKIQLMYGDTRKLNPNQEFELSLRATSSMEAGAVSLILNIPADLVEVKDAYMKGRNDKPVFNVKGNELRIGWNSLTPVNLEATEDLIILKLKTTSAFTEGKMIKIKLDTNSMNEIANDNFTVIPQIALNTDVLIGVNPGLLTLSGYPNPFSEYTTLSYTLPADANVTLRIYNLLGMLVQNLVNEHQSVATYTVNLDASKMQQGTYTAILRINDNIKIMERTIKLVVNR